jgi:hypothetical protein
VRPPCDERGLAAAKRAPKRQTSCRLTGGRGSETIASAWSRNRCSGQSPRALLSGLHARTPRPISTIRRHSGKLLPVGLHTNIHFASLGRAPCPCGPGEDHYCGPIDLDHSGSGEDFPATTDLIANTVWASGDLTVAVSIPSHFVTRSAHTASSWRPRLGSPSDSAPGIKQHVALLAPNDRSRRRPRPAMVNSSQAKKRPIGGSQAERACVEIGATAIPGGSR